MHNVFLDQIRILLLSIGNVTCATWFIVCLIEWSSTVFMLVYWLLVLDVAIVVLKNVMCNEILLLLVIPGKTIYFNIS